MSWKVIMAAPLALGLLAAGPALAKGPDGVPPGQAKKAGKTIEKVITQSGKTVDRTIDRTAEKAAETLAKGAVVGGVALAVDYFTDGEINTIRDYFIDVYRREGGVPAAYDPKGLPPGIAKNLARGKPLPPGIAKRYPPQGLEARLPARPGYERVIVGDDVYLVAAATGVIVDILVDVFKGA